jgi:uncharacterized membrane protein YccC
MAKPQTTFNCPAKAHLADAFHWSGAKPIEAAEVLAAGLGMAIPVLLAALNGHIALGLLAAAGSLAVGRVDIGEDFRSHLAGLARSLVPAIVAASLAILLRGSSWLAAVALVLVSAIAAIISGFSRVIAVEAMRFVVFLTIVSALPIPPASPDPWRPVVFLLLIVAGALWTALLSFALDTALRRDRATKSCAPNEPAQSATLRQKNIRWKRSLSTLAGWSYPIRLVSCLSLATAMDILCPCHHLHWVLLTVAILTGRQVQPASVKTTQRAIGTALGVVVASLFVRLELPLWVLILMIGLLAGLRPLLRNRNYLAYSAVVTPLVILIIDAGRKPENGILIDRLAATLTGALLVVAATLLFGRLSRSTLPLAEAHPAARQLRP